MIHDDDAGTILNLDAIHAVEPFGPLTCVHPREDDVALRLAVLPLLADRLHAVSDAVQLSARCSDKDDERLVLCVHDLLEVVRIQLNVCGKLVSQKLKADSADEGMT